MKLLARLMTSRYQTRSDPVVLFVKASEPGRLGGSQGSLAVCGEGGLR